MENEGRVIMQGSLGTNRAFSQGGGGSALLMLILNQATGETEFTNISLNRIAQMVCIHLSRMAVVQDELCFPDLARQAHWLLLIP